MTKNVNIAQLAQRSPMGVLILPVQTPLAEAIRRFADDPGTHGIALEDEGGRLAGVVNNRDLLDWARLQFDLFTRDFVLPVGRVRRLLKAVTIGDLAVPDSRQMAVRLYDSLDEALHIMAQFNLEDIVVIDGDGRIVNDLRLSEVLTHALEVTGGNTNAPG